MPCSGFGELALLYSAPRAASVVAVTDCKLWVMERAVYAAIKRAYQEELAALKRKMVTSVPLLAQLSEVGGGGMHAWGPYHGLTPLPCMSPFTHAPAWGWQSVGASATAGACSPWAACLHSL